MKSFRTSIVVATAAFALSLAGVSRAEDDVSSKKGTTKTHSTTTTGTSSTTTDATAPTTGAAPTDTTMPATTPSTSTDTTSGTGSDSAYGTGYGTTQPYQNQPYQQTQQQPAQQEPVQTQTTTYSTTTTTAGNYNANYNPYAGKEHDGWIHRPHRPLLYTGLGILVGTYATSAVVGATSEKDYDKNLYIPVAGPWIDLAERPCGFGDCGQSEDLNQALLIGSGVLQGVGTILTISSFFAREENVSPPNASNARARSTAAAKPRVQVTPMSYRAGGGFGAVGTF